jgi:hypothetical protein
MVWWLFEWVWRFEENLARTLFLGLVPVLFTVVYALEWLSPVVTTSPKVLRIRPRGRTWSRRFSWDEIASVHTSGESRGLRLALQLKSGGVLPIDLDGLSGKQRQELASLMEARLTNSDGQEAS